MAITAQEALASLPGRRKEWNIPKVSSLIEETSERNKVYIFNVGAKSWIQHMGTLGTFYIPECPEGEPFSTPCVVPGLISTTTVKDGEIVRLPEEDGRVVALDIIGVGPFKNASQDLRRHGVFIAKGPMPTEAELEAAESARDEEYARLVSEADSAYEVNGGMETNGGKTKSNIQRQHVDAAKALGLDRPWAKRHIRMSTCEGCGQPVLPTAVRCPNAGCGAILNEEKARKLYPHLYAHETPVTRGPGRPRNPEVA